MPEISDAELRQFLRYQTLGTVEELEKLPAKVKDLEADNHKYRQVEKPELLAKIPKDGDVVIPKAKADALAAYEALGAPEEVKATVEKAGTLESELANRDREAKARSAARANQWNEDAFLAMPGALDHTFEERGEGEAKEWYIVPPGENQQAAKLTEYVEQNARWKPLRPALAAIQQQPAPAGTRITPMVGDSGPRKTKPTEDDYRRATEQTASYTL